MTGRFFRGRLFDRPKRKVGEVVWDKVKDKLLAAAAAALAAFLAALLGTQVAPQPEVKVKVDAPPGVTVKLNQ